MTTTGKICGDSIILIRRSTGRPSVSIAVGVDMRPSLQCAVVKTKSLLLSNGYRSTSSRIYGCGDSMLRKNKVGDKGSIARNRETIVSIR